jgi:hypothetical protein
VSRQDHDRDADEALVEPNVAEEESQRDDAGRTEEGGGHAGWTLQGKLFGGVGVFIVLIALLYWFVSYEHAGSTLLALAAVLALMTAAYVAWPRKGHETAEDEHLEPGHDPHDGVWFPEASIWPFAIGAGMALIANGLLLGRWLVIPAAVFLAWSIAGMIRQGRHRI